MDESGVYIDDVKLQDLGIEVLLNSEEPFLAPVRRNTVTIPNRHGVHDYGAHLGALPITLNCLYPAESYNEAKFKVLELKKMLLDGAGRPKTVKLMFDDAPDRHYLVQIDSEILPEWRGLHAFFPLVFIAPDGCAFSNAKNDEVLWGSEELTFTAPYTFGHTGSGAKTFTAPGSTIVTITGNDVRPIIHITGSGTNVTISWGGNIMTLGTFSNATWLIDLDEYVITKNGVLALSAVAGNWMNMSLPQGDNTITIGGSGLNLNFSVEFQDRFF